MEANEYQREDSLLEAIEQTYRVARTDEVTGEALSDAAMIEKLCAAYAIPPSMLGELSNTNYDVNWEEHVEAYRQRFFGRKKK